MKKEILVILILILFVIIITIVYFLFYQDVRNNQYTNSVTRSRSFGCPVFSSDDISSLFDVPELFPGFLWKEIDRNQLGDYWPGYGAVDYIKLFGGEYFSVDILNGKAWSVNYEYKADGDYKIGGEFDRYYSEELSKRGWVWKTYVHGFEVNGIAADGPTGGSQGYIKVQSGKLRVIVTHEGGEYEGEFPYDAKLIATTFTVFLSDPISLSEILPGYKPGAYLGVTHVIITFETQKTKNLPINYGALVISDTSFESAVIPNSPAEKAGIQDGDIILSINGQHINQTNQLTKLLDSYCAGDRVILRILSKGIKKEVSVVLGEY